MKVKGEGTQRGGQGLSGRCDRCDGREGVDVFGRFWLVGWLTGRKKTELGNASST